MGYRPWLLILDVPEIREWLPPQTYHEACEIEWEHSVEFSDRDVERDLYPDFDVEEWIEYGDQMESIWDDVISAWLNGYDEEAADRSQFQGLTMAEEASWQRVYQVMGRDLYGRIPCMCGNYDYEIIDIGDGLPRTSCCSCY